MRVITVIIYFILAIVFFASTGVFVPYIIESIKDNSYSPQDLNQNVVTYFVAIFASACLDLVLKIIDKEVSYKKVAVLGLLLICIIFTGLTSYFLYLNANGTVSGGWLILGIIASWVMWAVAHYNDDVFNSPVNSLGGDTNRSLRNG